MCSYLQVSAHVDSIYAVDKYKRLLLSFQWILAYTVTQMGHHYLRIKKQWISILFLT